MTRMGFKLLVAPAAMALLLIGCEQPDAEFLIARAQQAYSTKDHRSAVLDLKSALQKDAGNAEARWLLAQIYLDLEDGASAEKELRRAHELGVGYDAVSVALANALLLQRKYDQVLAIASAPTMSVAILADLLALHVLAHVERDELKNAQQALAALPSNSPQSKYVQHAQARLLVAQDQGDAALQRLDAINRQFPEYAPAWSLSGDLLHAQRQFAAAEDAYTRAIALRVFSAEDKIRRGFSRVAQGKWQEALKDAAAIQAAAPKYHLGQYLAGLIHFQLGELNQAQDALTLALELSPRHFQTVFLLAALDARLGNANRGRQLAEQAVALQPTFVPARKLLAVWHLQDQRNGEAERLLKPIANAKPDDLQAQELLAASLIGQGKAQEAADLLLQIAAQRPDSAETQLRAGWGLLTAGEGAAGIRTLARAVALAPDDVDANAALIAGFIRQQAANQGLEAAQHFAARQPDDAQALSLLAAAQLANGDRPQAAATYEQVLVRDPGNLKASQMLATFALAQSDTGKARSYINKGLARNPGDLQLLMLQAGAAQQAGDAGSQVAALQQAINAHPQAPGPRALLARRHLDANEPEKALLVLSGVSEKEHSGILAVRAEAYHRLNRLDDAKRDLEVLARMIPDSADILFQLARTYEALGEKGNLEIILNRILGLEPDHKRARLAKARLAVSAGQLDDARRLLGDTGLAASEDPDVILTWMALARQEGDGVSEVNYARRMVDLQPSPLQVITLSRAQQRASNPTEAEKTLTAWLREQSSDVAVLTELANFYLGQGDIGKSVEQLRRIEAVDAKNLYALNNLAWYLRQGAPAEARAFAQRAYELAPNEPTVIDTYAMVLADSQDFPGALRMIDKAIEQAPQPAPLRVRRAEILQRSGDEDAAVAELESLLRDDPPGQIKEQAAALLARIRG